MTPGFTLVELIIIGAIIATMAAIAVPTVGSYVDKSCVMQAIADINRISAYISAFRAENSRLPDTLSEVTNIPTTDPWGNAYAYLNIETAKNKGLLRKDKNLVPINSDYDLYSKGKDGATASALTAKPSRDDIVRANNGGYVGLAASY